MQSNGCSDNIYNHLEPNFEYLCSRLSLYWLESFALTFYVSFFSAHSLVLDIQEAEVYIQTPGVKWPNNPHNWY